ncbi:MAG: hypothetical protein N2112_04285 [Gemmataceae bacterium]|nr:hypothetical protein [Gemmataceae bacterium]
MNKISAVTLALGPFLLGAAMSFFLFGDTSTGVAQDQVKGPKWQHGLLLRVRPADKPDFDKDTPKVGVEVFVDENNGNIIYINDKGGMAVIKK